jgi:hypothetical protein
VGVRNAAIASARRVGDLNGEPALDRLIVTVDECRVDVRFVEC